MVKSPVLKIYDLSAIYQFVHKGDWLEKDFAGCGEVLEGVGRVGPEILKPDQIKTKQILKKATATSSKINLLIIM